MVIVTEVAPEYNTRWLWLKPIQIGSEGVHSLPCEDDIIDAADFLLAIGEIFYQGSRHKEFESLLWDWVELRKLFIGRLLVYEDGRVDGHADDLRPGECFDHLRSHTPA
jgi:hypothetical protein